MSISYQNTQKKNERAPHGRLIRHIEEVLSVYEVADMDLFVQTLPAHLFSRSTRGSMQSAVFWLVNWETGYRKLARVLPGVYVWRSAPPPWRLILDRYNPFALAVMTVIGQRALRTGTIADALLANTQYDARYHTVARTIRALRDWGLVARNPYNEWQSTGRIDLPWSQPAIRSTGRNRGKFRFLREGPRDPDGMT